MKKEVITKSSLPLDVIKKITKNQILSKKDLIKKILLKPESIYYNSRNKNSNF